MNAVARPRFWALGLPVFLTALVGCEGAAAKPSPVEAPSRPGPASATRLPYRGMTVSCPIYGQIWGTDRFSESLETLKELGVEWVAIHPYAGVRRNGYVRFTPARETEYLAGAVERARKAGIALFWKPHLAYWGSFEWRGTIDFKSEDAKARFAETYRAFILDQARFAAEAKAPLFAVGVELELLVGYEAYWRKLIAEVRGVYPGRVTYAANFDGLDRVPFWDAVDLVGVQAYFPLSVPSGEGLPSRLDLRKAWAGPLTYLEGLSERTGRKILFTEIGYPEARHALTEPWKPKGFMDRATPELRAHLIDFALSELEALPYFAGMFWWKWIPGRSRGDFAMQPAEVRDVLQKRWRATAKPDASNRAAPP